MAVKTYGWCRVEGTLIIDKQSIYGSFINLPSTVDVFYGQPEVQIFNKDPNPMVALTSGVVYRQVFLKDLTHGNQFGTINEIDSSYSLLLADIEAVDKNIDTLHEDIYYSEPIAITESSVIYYASSNDLKYTRYTIIYVDKIVTPKVIAITSKYKGNPIPIGETFDQSDLEIYAIYEDGNKALIKQGYTLDPSDITVKAVGSNAFIAKYTTPEGKELSTGFVVTGIKSLVGVRAVYDGPTVAIGQEAEKKYFITTVLYSDGSSATATDFTFPDGRAISETNQGLLRIYYKGFYTEVQVPIYEVTSSRLIAWYNGPGVEIGNEWLKEYAKIKIYYNGTESVNSYYEDLSYEKCEFGQSIIDHEGVNQIPVTFNGKLGTVTTLMSVIGVSPQITLNFITANYVGPEVTVGKPFLLTKVIVKAYYSNSEIIEVTDFGVGGGSTVVGLIGPNEFLINYVDPEGQTANATITVIGVPKDSTTDTNYTPISLDNFYPEATKFNNRYRGPAEAYKHLEFANMMYQNINYLYDIFYSIEKDFNKIVDEINTSSYNKNYSLNNIKEIEETQKKWLNNKLFVNGYYKKIEE